MTNIYIHIGTEKTGTTSIQDALIENKVDLKGAKFNYLESFRHLNNHLYLALFAAPHSPKTLEIRKRLDLLEVEKLEKKLFKLKLSLTNELANNKYDVILSSEHLSSRIDSVNQTDRIKKLFTDILNNNVNFKIIVYLRRQDKLLESYYSTMIKVGNFRRFDINNILDPWFDYDGMLKPWIETFGAENIECRIFGKEKLESGDIVVDFFSLLKNDTLVDLTKVKTPYSSNKSLSRSKVALLCELNKVSNYLADRYDCSQDFRSGIVRILENMPEFHFKNDRIKLGSKSQKLIFEKYKESNSKVALRFFGKEKLFDEKFNDFDFDKIPEINSNEAIFTMAYVLLEKYKND